MRISPQKVGVSFLHDFPVSTLALVLASTVVVADDCKYSWKVEGQVSEF